MNKHIPSNSAPGHAGVVSTHLTATVQASPSQSNSKATASAGKNIENVHDYISYMSIL